MWVIRESKLEEKAKHFQEDVRGFKTGEVLWPQYRATKLRI
jgi:hypothetical protein